VPNKQLKCLILEDYSGFGVTLKKSLIHSGCTVKLLSTTDKYSREGDIDYLIKPRSVGLISKVELRIRFLMKLPFLVSYDVVLITNQSIIFKGISWLVLSWLSFFNRTIFLSVCGMDSVTFRSSFMSNFKYFRNNNLLSKERNKRYNSRWDQAIIKSIVSRSSRVIPMAYEYAEGWRQSEYSNFLGPTIPLPFYSPVCAETVNNSNKKIHFYHGLSREDKGSDLIVKAFDKCNKKYSSVAFFEIGERLPLSEFIKKIQSIDVLVDQCTAASYGSMTTLLGMSLGKVVMTQNASQALLEYNLDSAPVIAIENSVESIENAISYVLDSVDIKQLGEEAKIFVDTFHAPSKIAERYLTVFHQYL